MKDFNLLNPNVWHNLTLNHLNKVAESKEKSQTAKLVSSNFLAIGTGTAATLSQLLNISLIQPMGMVTKGAIYLARATTWSDFAQNVYKKLPGPTDWFDSAKKVAVYAVGTLLSIITTLGCLFTAKAAQLNVLFHEEGGVYHKIDASNKKADEKKADEKKTEDKKAEDKKVDDNALKEAVIAANKLPALSIIQTQADVAHKEALRIGKAILASKASAEDASNRAKVSGLTAVELDAVIQQANEATCHAEGDAKNAQAQADLLRQLLDQANTKLKAKQTDQACVDSFSALLKEAESAASGAKNLAVQTADFASRAVSDCRNALSDQTTLESYTKTADAASKEALRLAAETKFYQTSAEVDLAEAKNEKDSPTRLIELVSHSNDEAANAEKFASDAKVQLDLFAAMVQWTEAKETADPTKYSGFAGIIRTQNQTAARAFAEATAHKEAARTAADKIAAIQKAGQVKTNIADLIQKAQASYDVINSLKTQAEDAEASCIAAKNTAIQNAHAENSIAQPVHDAQAAATLARELLKQAQSRYTELEILVKDATTLQAGERATDQDLIDIHAKLADAKALLPSVEKETSAATAIEIEMNILKGVTDTSSKLHLPPLKEIKKSAEEAFNAVKVSQDSVLQLTEEVKSAHHRGMHPSATQNTVNAERKAAQEALEKAHQALAQASTEPIGEALEQVKSKLKAKQATMVDDIEVANLLTNAKTAYKNANTAFTEAEKLASELKNKFSGSHRTSLR